MMLLDHCIYLFQKRLDRLLNLKKKITMFLMAKDKQFLENYNKIWKKIEGLMGIDFESKATYLDDDDKYINTKKKTYKNSIITIFHNKKESKKLLELKIPHKCLSIII